MKVDRIFRELLFLLFALYNSQGWLYTAGSVISKGCLAGVILISTFYLFRTLLVAEKRPEFYTAWTLILFLNIAGFVFSNGLSDDKQVFMFKNILGCMLPFYPFYHLTRVNELKSSHLVRFALIMVPVTVFQFYYYRDIFMLEYIYDENAVVNNIAYSFVGLIPFAFLIRKKNLYPGLLMTLLMFFIIQSVKRGAIISGLAGLTFFVYYKLKNVEAKNKITGYLIVISALAAIIFFTYKNLAENEFLIYRMNSAIEGDTSGRSILYGTIFNAWYNCSNFFRLIFGFGFASSIRIAGDYAHNDWLELLSNFGLTGIIFYIYFFYAAVKFMLEKGRSAEMKIIMAAIISMWFIISLISMGYTSMNYATFAVLLGFITVRRNNLQPE